jgi:hypothetical protein
MCVEVEVADVPLSYNILLGRNWTYTVTAVVSTIFLVLCFPHEGRIIIIDHLSLSRPDPSSGASMVLMINNPHPGTINLGVELFPYLMGNFDYSPPANDVKFISVVPDQSKATIFQVASFRTSYFNDLWTLPSPSTSMEGVGHPRMAMHLSVVEFSYSIVQQASSLPNPTSPQELDLVLEPIWAQDSLATHDPLDLVFPSDEVILEAMNGLDRPWDDLHHISYFLPELRRVEAGEFTTIMNGYVTCPFNLLAMHKIYAQGNMKSISKTIPINICRTPGVMENVFVGSDCSSEEIQIYTELFKELCDVFS